MGSARYGALPTITINTDPPGLSFNLSGIPATAPVSYLCKGGETADIPSPQVNGSTRYVFESWSDAAPQARPVPCLSDLRIEARFSSEFEVVVGTDPPGMALFVDSARENETTAHWWKVNSTHQVLVPPYQEVGRARFTFVRWSDGGPANRSLLISGPLNLTATLGPFEYEVRVETVPTGLELTVDGLPTAAPIVFWWVVDSTHSFSPTTPQPGSPGMRFVFSNWFGGGPVTRSITVTSPVDIVAAFTVEYAITIASNGPFEVLVDGAPAATPFEVWWEAASVHDIGIPAALQEGPDLGTRYGFDHWSDGGPRNHTVSATGPALVSVLFGPAAYLVSVGTDPPGLPLWVDDTNVTTPTSLWWPAGTGLWLRAESTVIGDRSRYTFSHWTPQGSQQFFAAISEPLNFTAQFATEFQVRFDSALPSVFLQVDGASLGAPSAVWWANGSRHRIDFRSPVELSADQRALWSAWSIGGSQDQTIIVAGPLDVMPLLVLQFLLSSDRGEVACDAVDCWYPAGALATVTVESPVAGPTGTRFVLNGTEPTDRPIARTVRLLIEGPTQVGWRTQFRLTLVSAHGIATGAGWYDAGSTAEISVDSSVVEDAGNRLRFDGWVGAINSSDLVAHVTMQGPALVTASWSEAHDGASSDWLLYGAIAATAVAAALLLRRIRPKTERPADGAQGPSPDGAEPRRGQHR